MRKRPVVGYVFLVAMSLWIAWQLPGVTRAQFITGVGLIVLTVLVIVVTEVRMRLTPRSVITRGA
jgi:hypothetical protein